MVKPQDKEMKMRWITVDGRRTPVILPQIWNHEKEDWVVTSTENPLPTQLTGSIVEDGLPVRDINSNIVLLKERSHKDIDLNVPGNSQKIINESIDVGDYRYLIFQFIPSAGGKYLNYRIKYHYSRGDSTNTMQEITVLKVGGSSNNQVSDKVEVLFKYIKVVIANEEEHDHEFGKYYILGVRK